MDRISPTSCAADGSAPSADAPVARVIAAVSQTQMVLPLQLLLDSHRPLAFAVGQCLALLEPLARLFPAIDAASWSQFLSRPDAASLLLQRLQADAGAEGSARSGATRTSSHCDVSEA